MMRPFTTLRWPGIGLVLGMLMAAAGCAGGGGSGGQVTTPSPDTSQQPPAAFDFGPNNPFRADAFGDSITRGVLGDVDGVDVVTGNNYPNNLQLGLRTLDGRWRVVNRGLSGEQTSSGRSRIRGVLAIDRPGFVLIMEGTNDATDQESPTTIVANLESMVTQAQANHTIPVIGTIPPNFRNAPVAQSIIKQSNEMIRNLARSRNVVLAEIFDGMNDRSLFGAPERGIPDPLHPNERGYVRMASIWFAAMQKAIPAPPAPAPTIPAPSPTPAPSPSPSELGQRPAPRPPRH